MLHLQRAVLRVVCVFFGAVLSLAVVDVASADAPPTKRMLMLGGGIQEVPPVSSDAFCAGVFEIDTVANTCAYRIVHSDMMTAETAAHIHGPAAPGANGGVQHALPLGKVKTGTWNYPEAIEADLVGGNLYVNIHSMGFPGGELRGQICDMVCTLDSDQPVPPLASPVRGFGAFQIDEATNQLDYHIFYDPPLTSPEFAAHIHLPGLIGENQLGTPPHTLPGGPLKQGSWSYPDGFEEDLTTGRAYVLVHSTQFLGGEVRGQIAPSLSVIDGPQSVPTNMSPGVGYLIWTVDAANGTMGWDMRIEDITGTEMFTVLHGPAAVGVGGAPGLFTFPNGLRKLGNDSFAPEIFDHFYDCLLYIDVHTSTFPGGEIRAQLWPRPNPVPEFVRGDCNQDDSYNIADAVTLLGFAFPPMPPPTPLPCDDACDCNDDGVLNIADAVCILNGLFTQPSVPPVAPHPDCGVDPTSDSLDCANPTCP